MFDMPEDVRADRALRDGLASLPVPETSADFDARIRAAVRRTPLWRIAWEVMRPALPAAACSMVVMLALLNWSERTPARPQATRTALEARAGASEGAFDSVDLSRATLSYLFAPSRPARPVMPERETPPTPRPRRPKPDNRAQLSTRPVV